MLKPVLFALLLLPLLFVSAGLFLPAEWTAESSTVIAAEREVIVAHVANLETWPDWTAWNRAGGPSTQWEFSGEPGSSGAAMTWTGPDEEYGVGAVRLTAVADEVRYDIEFDGGSFLGYGGFRFEDVENGTRVTWFGGGDLGRNPVSRWVGLMMDGLVAVDFERGLAGLRGALEASGGDPETGDPGISVHSDGV